jgi:hypothetical protein
MGSSALKACLEDIIHLSCTIAVPDDDGLIVGALVQEKN